MPDKLIVTIVMSSTNTRLNEMSNFVSVPAQPRMRALSFHLTTNPVQVAGTQLTFRCNGAAATFLPRRSPRYWY